MDLAAFFSQEPDSFTIPAGELIFRTGAPADSMYVLLAGTAEVFVGERSVETAQPGALLGEMALIEHRPRAADVRAVTDCQLLAIDETRFLQLVAQTPEFATHVMRTMAARLRRMDDLIAEKAPDSAA